MKLYTYWRSTASYRVRIALALKGIEAEQIYVNLVRDGGEQNAPAYRSMNPQGRVPALELDGGEVLVQSPAIIEYLEEIHPLPPLLPNDPIERAKARAVAAIIACDIHPLHNSGPLNYLRKNFGRSEDEVTGWIVRWMTDGLTAVEAMVGETDYCFGEQPGLADIYLVPQLYAARRFKVPLEDFPKLQRVEALCLAHPAFISASPEKQADAAPA